ncbi:DUF4326 domain-containing protein [Streptomyces sp. NPDC048664]|uniref:DUF4326 domain-containing protein n=1 Tax=Streptomyces sp. NPDC048664 TaxID=3154505 RepID=UPI003430CE84
MTDADPPRRIQRRRTAGWRAPQSAVYVGRPSRWGNPYAVRDHDAEQAVCLFRTHIEASPDLRAAVRAHLAGRDLMCWCPPGTPCHADVLLTIANDPELNTESE